MTTVRFVVVLELSAREAGQSPPQRLALELQVGKVLQQELGLELELELELQRMLRLCSELVFGGCLGLFRYGTRLAQECARRIPVLLAVCSLDIPRFAGRCAIRGILLLSA